MNHARLLAKLGTGAAIATALNRHPSTISVWRQRGIPPAAWGAIVRLARQHNIVVTFEDLERNSPRYGQHGPARADRKSVPARRFAAEAQ